MIKEMSCNLALVAILFNRAWPFCSTEQIVCTTLVEGVLRNISIIVLSLDKMSFKDISNLSPSSNFV